MSGIGNFYGESPSLGGKKASPALVFVVFGLIALFCIGYGITGFVGEKVTLDEAFSSGLDGGEIVSGVPPTGSNQYNLKVKNRVNMIPLGDEYYFLICSENEDKAFIVRAEKEFGDNFDGEYKNFRNKAIKGKVKRTNSRVESNFTYDRMLDSAVFIDLTSTRLSIMWIIAGILSIVLIICFAIQTKKNKYDEYMSTGTKVGLGSAMLISMLVAGCLIIYLIMRF